MKKKRTLTVVAMVLAVLMLGVGYAAISEINLNITGNATASPNADQFAVKFVSGSAKDVTVSKPAHIMVNPAITSDLAGTIEVTGMKARGESVTVQYSITNASADLSATLEAEVGTGTNNKFTIETDLGTDVLAKGATTTLTITITLNETPVSSDITTTVPVTVTATPTTPAA